MKEAKNLTLLFFVLIACSSCYSNSDETVKPITTNPFIKSNKCYSIMRSLLDEWVQYGGGYKSSIHLIREQIKNDEVTKFSSIVKQFWEHQEALGISVNIEKIGSWPISDDKYRTVFFVTDDLSKYDLDGCSLTWLDDVIYDRVLTQTENGLRRMNERIEEFPDSYKWESRDAQLWFKYWIFVNIENN